MSIASSELAATFTPAKVRRMGRRRNRGTEASPTRPTLTAAAFNPLSQNVSLVLTFDVNVDVAGFDGSAILVTDGSRTPTRYAGAGAVVQSPANVVHVGLVSLGPAASPTPLLNASADNGIVAVDGAGGVGGVGGGADGPERRICRCLTPFEGL